MEKSKGAHILVGAFGEKAVEVELLRRGWITANVNASIKNSADFDIFAWKGKRSIHLRVKTCGPRFKSFQFGGFKPETEISSKGFSETDFTILVKMGHLRQDDFFYIVPTKVIRKRLSDYRKQYLDQKKRDGNDRKDIGHWTLHLPPRRNGEKRFNYDIQNQWKSYLNNWESRG